MPNHYNHAIHNLFILRYNNILSYCFKFVQLTNLILFGMSYLQNAENKTSTSNIISLAEHLGTRISDHIPETPNRISEDMIKCMSTIYCKLSDPLTMNHGVSSSPISCSSPISSFSPQYQYDMWSPRCRKDSSYDSRLDKPRQG